MDKKLLNSANKYLANVGVSYIKLHNLHWNVVGLNFKAVHEYLEGIYDSMAEVLDEVAELIKMDGGYPLASLKEYLAVASIEELESRDYKILESLDILLKDLKALREEVLEIRSIADELDNVAFVNMAEDHLANYNKQIWFVESMLK